MAHTQIAISLFDISEVVFLSVTIFYFLLFSWILYGWNKLCEVSEYNDDDTLTVSVIIAARNEKENLPLLLGDLALQTYPAKLIEIIIIDDHSDENIKNLPSVRNSNIQNLRVVPLPDHLTGKKHALVHAARMSQSELLLFTDADCRIGPGWIKSFAQYYTLRRPDLILGLVDNTDSPQLIQQFFRLEFMALVITGAGTAALGFPTICNGANLAVNRKVYLELSQYIKTETPSGDDVFMLHAVKRRKGSTIAVNRSKSSVVTTMPLSSLPHFLNQRARWASKGVNYSDRDTMFLAIAVLLVNLMIILCFIYALCTGKYRIFIFVFAIKTIADCLVTGAGLKFFKGFRQLVLVPLFEIVYPVYMLVALVIGPIQGYYWKGRKV